MCSSTHLLAYNSVYSSTVSYLLLSHHNWPLLFSEDHESIQWFFDIRMVFIRLVKRLCVTAKKQTNTNINYMFNDIRLFHVQSIRIQIKKQIKNHAASRQGCSHIICLVYRGKKKKKRKSYLLLCFQNAWVTLTLVCTYSVEWKGQSQVEQKYLLAFGTLDFHFCRGDIDVRESL